MTWSLNEIEAEAKKAVRGAGLSWGLSEDGGKAARWLAAHGVDPLPSLTDVLERHDRGTIATALVATARGWRAEMPICPIKLGVTLCDNADRLAAQVFVGGPVARPLLLAPFAAIAARILGRSLLLDLGTTQIVLTADGDASGDLALLDVSDARETRCAPAERLPSADVRRVSTHGIETDPRSWARLAAYVKRTYVPASERSRREGAGAGLIDND